MLPTSIPDVTPVMALPPVPAWLTRWADFAAKVSAYLEMLAQ